MSPAKIAKMVRHLVCPRTQVVGPNQAAAERRLRSSSLFPWRLLGSAGRPPLVEDVEGHGQEQDEALDKGLNLSAETEQ